MYKIRVQEICLNLQQMGQEIILSPRGCLPLPRGYIHVYNHKKTCVKSLQRICFENDRSDKMFLLTSKVCPMGLSAPEPQLYTFI